MFRDGPIILDFSTPINIENLKRNLTTDFIYFKTRLHCKEDGKLFKDYSRVEVLPNNDWVLGKIEINVTGLCLT